MKNNFKLIIFIYFKLIVSSKISLISIVNFDVSEIEITENGDIMKVIMEERLLRIMELRLKLKLLNI